MKVMWKILFATSLMNVSLSSAVGEPASGLPKCFEDSEVLLEAGVEDAVSADVDSDGIVDVILLQPPNLIVLRNDGHELLPHASFKIGKGVTKLAVGHINADDAPDLGILRGDELVIYLNTGTGYADDPTNIIPTATGPVHLLFGDLEDDGDDDVVTTHNASGQMKATLLTPAGAVQNSSTIFTFSGAKKAAMANLNGDALPDLIVISSTGARMLFNRGTLQFDSLVIEFPQSSYFQAYQVIAADFVQGGFDEAAVVIVANIDRGYALSHLYLVSVAGDESLSYQTSALEQFYYDHTAIAAVDQDVDGDIDLWTGGRYGSGIPVAFLENDDGQFTRRSGADAANSPHAIIPIEMNGKRNLIVSDGAVKLLRSQFGSFMHTLNYELLNDVWYGVSAGDLNNDGADEIVAFSVDGIVAHWGGERAPWQAQLLVPGYYEHGPVVDFNGDGLQDIVGMGDIFRVFVQRPDGTFHLGYEIKDGRIIEIGDVNKDGRVDAVSSYQCSLYLQQPDQSFIRFPGGCGTNSCTYGVILADMNRDDMDDFVRSFAVCLSNGDGTFGEYIGFNTSNTIFPSPSAVGDLDNDGDMDFVLDNEFCCNLMPGFYVYINDGYGNLTRLAAPTGFGPRGNVGASVTLIDIDGDGLRDFVHGTGWEGGLWYERGNGDGTLTGVQGWSCGYMGYIGLSAVGDFDGDGAIDLAGAAVDSENSSFRYLARVYGTCVVNCREDINHDDRVNVVDLFQLLKDWGHCPSCFSDLDGDDFVGRGDLDRLFDTWGDCD